jgi:hypothetical protein
LGDFIVHIAPRIFLSAEPLLGFKVENSAPTWPRKTNKYHTSPFLLETLHKAFGASSSNEKCGPESGQQSLNYLCPLKIDRTVRRKGLPGKAVVQIVFKTRVRYCAART